MQCMHQRELASHLCGLTQSSNVEENETNINYSKKEERKTVQLQCTIFKFTSFHEFMNNNNCLGVTQLHQRQQII